LENGLVVSLAVSGLGMLLLFIALTILYGLMYLMTSVLRDPGADPVHARPEEQRVPGGEEAATRAAVIAVALARARHEPDPLGVSARGEGMGADAQHLEVSAWWALHHDRQLARKPKRPRSP
jgi:Na+-transporting methylmalonyl-CoA/oxaloacetate decarboxylase gamma subunit